MRQEHNKFVGRLTELAQLKPFLNKKTASLLVIRGRRRVGKSRLIEEFAKNSTFYKFTGLAPVKGVTAQDQRNEFARQLSEQLNLPLLETSDWGALFSLLGRIVNNNRIVILFDEISWMAHGDNTFLSKLKNAWEDHYKKNPRLILILCGSISTWIEENIITSTGYFGRISWTMNLEPLPIKDCYAMLKSLGFNTTHHEIFKLLSVTGGIPWYLEQMDGKLTVDENIKRQCFTSGGVLVDDFDLIFHELFIKRDEIYKKIIMALSNSLVDYDTISTKTNYPKSGRLSTYLDDLIKAGFITKDETWSLKTGKILALCHYRLSDNYLRFYLKYILPKKPQIQKKHIEAIQLPAFPGWESIMGLQFENLVVNNRLDLYQALNINPADVVYDNPYFQTKTKKQLGCQIDFLIQTKLNTLYIIEIKFSRNPIGLNVIESVKDKISRLSLPKNMVCIPVLIHVNGVSEPLVAENYFYAIINFASLL
ncbi:MAG: ATPase [Legionellales bacterium RIFCSPHIGHO2_12_FULL_42_9]|nr:MAG: ATPase [Legionellales bacterium RIFCSPHIGHO2_12_FULL_42_9]